MERIYWKPTKPYNIGQLINKILVSQYGSPLVAQQAEFSNYNGHIIMVTYNEVRKYWIAEYTWAGRRVIARGNFENVLSDALMFFEHSGAGSEVRVSCRNDEEVEVCLKCGLEEYSSEVAKAHYRTFETWKHEEASMAVWAEKKLGASSVAHLLKAQTKEEYEELCEKNRPKIDWLD